MKFNRQWMKLALLISMVAVVSFVVPLTLAYVFDQTDTIVNTFAPPKGLNEQTSVEIDIVKTVINTGDAVMGLDGFRFTLENVLTAEKTTVTSDEKGNANFTLFFSGVDTGKSFRFKVYEENDGAKDVTYSKASYVVQIDLSMVDEKPVAAVQIDGKPTQECVLGFTNEYAGMSVPETGDVPWLGLYACILVIGVVAMGLIICSYRKEQG